MTRVRKKRPTAAAAALQAMLAADRAVKATDQKSREARERQQAARDAYTSARPLTEWEREELVDLLWKGEPLCCQAGLANLRKILPEPWAQALNGWAYEALACKGTRPRPDPDEIAKVRALAPDRFPCLN